MVTGNRCICEVLRLCRIANDFSIRELSDKSSISASYIADIERGVKYRPSINIIEQYSKACGIRKSDIMSLEEEFRDGDVSYQVMLLKVLQKMQNK